MQQEQRQASRQSARLLRAGHDLQGDHACDRKPSRGIEARAEVGGQAGSRRNTDDCITRHLIFVRMIRRVVVRRVVSRLKHVCDDIGKRRIAGMAEEQE